MKNVICINYEDFSEIPKEEFNRLIIFIRDDLWMDVLPEDPGKFGLGLSQPYTCLFEDHELTRLMATLKLHELSKEYLSEN